MAEMALGYGSEFQLLRYLGHHRNYLNSEICKVTHSNSPIKWLDYPINLSRDSRDGELTGIQCFEKLSNFAAIKKAWKEFWPQRGSAHNWDGIFIQDDIWYFVEAKAHLEEANQKCTASSKESIDKIIAAFEKTCGSRDLAQKWIDSDCYQLANRLAFVNFCKSVNIRAKAFYISFVNGYEQNPNINVLDESLWINKWQEEFKVLEVSDNLREDIICLTIDCQNPKGRYFS